jgi:hypothetical protein
VRVFWERVRWLLLLLLVALAVSISLTVASLVIKAVVR